MRTCSCGVLGTTPSTIWPTRELVWHWRDSPLDRLGTFSGEKKHPEARCQKEMAVLDLEVSSPASVGAPPAGSLLSGEATLNGTT